MLVGSILWLAQVLTMIGWGEGNLRKTEEGQRVLERLSSAGLFFLRWRAFADHKKELRSLGKLAGWMAVLAICIFLMSPSSAKPMLSGYCLLFLGLWLSIRIGRDVKGQISEVLTMSAVLFCAPFVVLFVDWLHVLPHNLLKSFVAPIPHITTLGFTGFQLALLLAVIGAGATIVLNAAGILMFSVIPLFILFVMVLISKLSRNLLSWKLSRARNFVAAYVLLIGPTLIFLHSNHLI